MPQKFPLPLRSLYLLDGILLLAVGLPFWGWTGLIEPWFGVDTAGDILEHFNLWKAISFGDPFGGALMLAGCAALALAQSDDPRLLRKAARFFTVGHACLGVIVLAKAQALWETPAAFLLTDVLGLPAAAFLYLSIAESAGPPPLTAEEQRIREAAGQAERTRLAQDLHDSVKQQIYSVQTHLATAQTRWEQDAVGAREAVDHARSTARDAMAEMVALLDRLRHDPIEGVGLVEALRRQAEALGFQTGAEVATKFGDLPLEGLSKDGRLEPSAATAVFRIAQEALANVARHARPQHVRVELTTEEAAHRLQLRVVDDGQGFATDAPPRGMGLANMTQRAAEIGGQLWVNSVPGQGCTVTLRVPLQDSAFERRLRLGRRVAAVAVPTAFMTWIALIWPEWRPHFLPLITIGAVAAGGMVAGHVWRTR